jgi:hypothetical protein
MDCRHKLRGENSFVYTPTHSARPTSRANASSGGKAARSVHCDTPTPARARKGVDGPKGASHARHNRVHAFDKDLVATAQDSIIHPSCRTGAIDTCKELTLCVCIKIRSWPAHQGVPEADWTCIRRPIVWLQHSQVSTGR